MPMQALHLHETFHAITEVEEDRILENLPLTCFPSGHAHAGTIVHALSTWTQARCVRALL